MDSHHERDIEEDNVVDDLRGVDNEDDDRRGVEEDDGDDGHHDHHDAVGDNEDGVDLLHSQSHSKLDQDVA